MIKIYKFNDFFKNIDSGKVKKINFKEGDYVKKGDVLIEIDSVKVSFDFVCPFKGQIRKIFIKNEDFLKFDDNILSINH